MNAVRRLPFRFTGTGGQYFGIWIVNLLLTIVTFGLYAPWAKVRKQQFFYGHTELEGERFDYTGQPMAILRGRLLAIGLLVVLQIMEAFDPRFLFATVIVVALAMPWLVQRTMRFNAFNSRYRNLRLRFDGGFGEAFLVYLPLLLVSFLLFPLLPYWQYRHKRYLHGHLGYGDHRFRFEARLRDFYFVYIEALLLFLFALVVMFLVGSQVAPAALSTLSKIQPGSDFDPAVLAVLMPFFLLVLLSLPVLYFILVVYTKTKITNLCWGYTSVGRNRFRLRMSVWRMAWIYFSNQLLLVLTLGLFTPWAQVRLARYRMACTTVDALDDPADFFSSAQSSVSAAGEEMADIFGVDISL